ncbi:MAG: YihY/virulence factor BrkB family protein [Chloracidobacterium sp.]|nr:YihY/virulence factor BrkB family protein [Chloracidobacterium sp.]
MTANFEWKRFFSRLYDVSFDADIFSRAAQVAFYFSFALFPLLYFLVSLFGLLLESSDGLRNELFTYLKQIMPVTAFDLVRKTVDEIVANSTGGKLTLGLVVTLWSASAGVDAIRNALNAVYGFVDQRRFWWTKLQSLALTLIVCGLTMAVLAIVFYGWQLVQYSTAAVGFEVTSPLLLIIIQWISTFVVMLAACEVIYNLLPAFGRFRWIWITPGSLVAIVLWILLTTAFRTYLGYFNSYNKAYGSLGAVMIMMLWLYLTALALMIGGVINAMLHEMRAAPMDVTGE